MVVLSAARGDLYRAEQRGKTARGGPVETGGDAVEQAGPVGVSAPGRVHYRLRRHAWDLDAVPVRHDERAARAERHHQRRHFASQLLELLARALLQHLALVVIHRNKARHCYELV